MQDKRSAAEFAGFGLFETMRAYQKKVVYLDAHLNRLKDSCRLLKISCPYSLSKLKEMIQEAIERNGFSDVYLKLTLWKAEEKTTIFIDLKRYQAYPSSKYRQGFSCGISCLKQNEYSFLARLKSTNRLFYQFSLKEARVRGFDEAIILNSRGYLAEGTRSNLFFVKDRIIFTPSLECGCLDGVTRRVVFDLAKKYKFKIYVGSFTIQDLLEADEAFLTNSLIGLMPMESLEGKTIGFDQCRRLTEFFQKKYRCLLK